MKRGGVRTGVAPVIVFGSDRSSFSDRIGSVIVFGSDRTSAEVPGRRKLLPAWRYDVVLERVSVLLLPEHPDVLSAGFRFREDFLHG